MRWSNLQHACATYDAAIFQVFGDGLRLVAQYGRIIPTSGPVGQVTFPLVRWLIGGCAVIDRRTIQVADMLAEADETGRTRSNTVIAPCSPSLLSAPARQLG